MKTILLILLAISLTQSSSNGQLVLSADSWSNQIQQNDLPAIAKLIHSPKGIPWPKLVSDASQAMKKGEANIVPSKLGEELLEKMRDYENSRSHESGDLIQAAEVLGSLSQGLEKSGGYVNLSLANASNSVALANLFEVVINKPDQFGAAEVAFGGMDCVKFSTSRFLQMMSDETAQKLNPKITLTLLTDQEVKEKIFTATGVDESNEFTDMIFNKVGTGDLIRSLKVGYLCDLMIQTDLISKRLGCVLDFLSHGGKYSELNLGDVRPYNAVMGQRIFAYKSDFAQVRYTGVEDILPLLTQFKDARSSLFVQRALK